MDKKHVRVWTALFLWLIAMGLSGCLGGGTLKNATMSPNMYVFESLSPSDASFIISWGSAKAVRSVTFGSMGLSGNEYEVVGNVLVIKAEFLAERELGEYQVVVKLDKGSSVNLTVLVVHQNEQGFYGGTGTSDDPFLVATAAQLDNVRNYLDSHFLQIADIDLSSFLSGDSWDPIGTYIDDFHSGNELLTGSYDGGDKQISSLIINLPNTSVVGLFSSVFEGELKNIHLVDMDVTGERLTGALVGLMKDSTMVNCSASGTVTGSHQTGLLVGYNWAGTIEDSFTEGALVASGNTIGGLAGRVYDGTVRQCYSTVDVQSNDTLVGGLVGSVESESEIISSYAAGDVVGDQYVGGLVGRLIGGVIEDCYALGESVGTFSVGGLVGHLWSGTQVKNSYSTGEVTADSGAGGLVGENSGTITNSYYNGETSGQADTGKGISKTTLEMIQVATYTDWDFSLNWTIVELGSYPYLKWQQDTETLVDTVVVSIDKVGSGTVDPAPGSYTYPLGATVDLVATPEDDWEFDKWVVDGDEFFNSTLSLDLSQVTTVVAIFTNPDFAGGAGTPDYPFLIASADELDRLRDHLDMHFELVADVDLTAYSAGEGWEPIGTSTNPFTGTMEGNGFSVLGLTINREDATHQGLFGYILEASLKDVILRDVDIEAGWSETGSLVGRNSGSTISGCQAFGTVAGTPTIANGNIGGLVGRNEGGTITDCSTSVTVMGDNGVGGLVGYNDTDSLIQDSYAEGEVVGDINVGGLVGTNRGFLLDSYATAEVDWYDGPNTHSGNNIGGLVGENQTSGRIGRCFASGAVSGVQSVGGLVGVTLGQSIFESFATGEVAGGSTIGGLIGYIHSNTIVSDCYALGSVSGNSDVGGLVGFGQDVNRCFATGAVEGTGTNIGGLIGRFGARTAYSYYDQDTTGQSDTGKGEPRSTEDMKKQDTFEPQWDFDTVWVIDEEMTYPYFKWQLGL